MRTWYFKDGEPELDALGNIKIIEGLESLAENIDQRYKLFKGKYFMDITAGVPYLEDILIKPIDPGFVASILTAEAKKEDEVTGVESISTDLNPDKRIFSYNATINSIFGTTEISG